MRNWMALSTLRFAFEEFLLIHFYSRTLFTFCSAKVTRHIVRRCDTHAIILQHRNGYRTCWNVICLLCRFNYKGQLLTSWRNQRGFPECDGLLVLTKQVRGIFRMPQSIHLLSVEQTKEQKCTSRFCNFLFYYSTKTRTSCTFLFTYITLGFYLGRWKCIHSFFRGSRQFGNVMSFFRFFTDGIFCQPLFLRILDWLRQGRQISRASFMTSWKNCHFYIFDFPSM